ncbi:MAG: hypothetical protein Q8R17_01625 [bacterium]|nr:hypothetical protein [bacterium]
MSFIRTVFIASVVFAVLPLIGVPLSWKTIAQFLLSFFLFISAYREYRKIKSDNTLS